MIHHRDEAWRAGREAWRPGCEAWRLGCEAWRAGCEAWRVRNEVSLSCLAGTDGCLPDNLFAHIKAHYYLPV